LIQIKLRRRRGADGGPPMSADAFAAHNIGHAALDQVIRVVEKFDTRL
jgi:hypothetical protein